MVLLNAVGNDLKHCTSRNYAIIPEIQLLIALRYYATGAFQVRYIYGSLLNLIMTLQHFYNKKYYFSILRYTLFFQVVLGDHIQVHKSTVCRIVKRVSKRLACLRPLFISMPKNQNEKQAVQIGFYQMHNFPRVIGAIDCTHIRIQSPNSDIGEQFRNRKGYFSFNVQAVCNSKMEIMNIVARYYEKYILFLNCIKYQYYVFRWPGSVHDSTVFDNSLLRAQFENNEFEGCFLLGDGGYPCRSYLMTPLLNPTTNSEKNYQVSIFVDVIK